MRCEEDMCSFGDVVLRCFRAAVLLARCCCMYACIACGVKEVKSQGPAAVKAIQRPIRNEAARGSREVKPIRRRQANCIAAEPGREKAQM